MRNARSQGFTLIELLIVIAIIGILAAVLIPNLLGARRTAQDRAAQAYAQNVYTLGNAYLAEDVDAEGNSLAGDCTNGYTVGQYSAGDPGTAVKSCTVTGVAGSTDFTVSVTSANDATYVLP